MAAQQLSFHEKLYALARNYWWCWQPEVVAIYRDIDPIRWRELDHNPVLMLDEFTADGLALRHALPQLPGEPRGDRRIVGRRPGVGAGS